MTPTTMKELLYVWGLVILMVLVTLWMTGIPTSWRTCA